MATFSQAFNAVAGAAPGTVHYSLTVTGRGVYRIEKRKDSVPPAVYQDGFPAACTHIPIEAGLSDAWKEKTVPMTLPDVVKKAGMIGYIRRRAWGPAVPSLALCAVLPIKASVIDEAEGSEQLAPAHLNALDVTADDWYVVKK